MDIRFDGKTALVTGAGKGIGRGVAVKLAQGGAKVIAISRTQEDLDSLKEEVPGIECHCLDIADWDATRKLVEGLGPVDLLVNNAGVTNWSSFVDVTKEELDGVFDINFRATFNISQVVVKGMLERGSGGAIVNMSSVGSMRAPDRHTIYCSTKGAMDSLTQSMAVELGPNKIRVNSVHPCFIMTAMGKKGMGDPKKLEQYEGRIPLRALPKVEDVVNTTLYLLSDQAAMMTGVFVPVDGGITCTS